MGYIIGKLWVLIIRIVVLALMLFGLYALYNQFLVVTPPAPEENLDGLHIVDIEDGDTGLLSDGNRLRFLGVDTPEIGESFYDEATEFTEHFCKDRPVRLEYDVRKSDKYDRLLAYVFVDDTLMENELLVEAGLANVYIFPYDQKNMQYRGRLIKAQIRAIAANRGIWSLPEPKPEEFFYGNSNSFRFHRPGCRGLNRADTSKMIKYESRHEFLSSGFSPCRACKP